MPLVSTTLVPVRTVAPNQKEKEEGAEEENSTLPYAHHTLAKHWTRREVRASGALCTISSRYAVRGPLMDQLQLCQGRIETKPIASVIAKSVQKVSASGLHRVAWRH